MNGGLAPALNPARRIEVGSRTIGDTPFPFIIAEIACAHEGRMDLAHKLIDAAVDSHADAVQLELFVPGEIMVPSAKLFPLLEQLYFDPEQWKELFDHVHARRECLFCFCYDLPSLELALELGCDGLKLNSSDLSNPDLLRAAARSGLPFTLGTGASTEEEVAAAVEFVLAKGADKFILMHGVQNFPTPIDTTHIVRVALLSEKFDCLVGYADHTDPELPISRNIDFLAMGLGASVLEKHITHDRSFKGVDHQAALNPDEFADWVATMRQGASALGQRLFRPLSEGDWEYRRFQKKSLYIMRELAVGQTITRNHLGMLRSGGDQGISPMRINEITGRTTSRSIPVYTRLTEDMLED